MARIRPIKTRIEEKRKELGRLQDRQKIQEIQERLRRTRKRGTQ